MISIPNRLMVYQYELQKLITVKDLAIYNDIEFNKATNNKPLSYVNLKKHKYDVQHIKTSNDKSELHLSVEK